MVTVQAFLGFSLCALLILHTHGFPYKGSKAQGQSSSHQSDGDDFAPHRGSATGRYAPMYGASRDFRAGQMVGPAPSSPYMFVQSAPAPGMMDSESEEVSAGAGFAPGQAGPGFPAGGPGYPGGAGYPGAFVPVQAAYPVGAVPLVPRPAGYDAGSAQAGGPESSLPETKWTVEPKIFSEEGLANTQALDSSMLLPQNPAPSGPVLQSGETSNVVKEAELGNYQHETEEFGYPGASMGPGQGLPSYPMPYVGGGGVFWGSPYLYPLSSPYPNFDYRLLYGMYPPGTYTTFSKNHEKGKDYYQSIHYLKEHVSETPSTPGSGQQQKKIFPQVPQRA